jgi:hypothetical protein
MDQFSKRTHAPRATADACVRASSSPSWPLIVGLRQSATVSTDCQVGAEADGLVEP